jgi:hypothetical protein
VPEAEADEHQRHEELRAALEGFGDAYLAEHDEEPQREERDGVPCAPKRRDAGCPPHTGFPLNEGGYDDHVVRIGGVAKT